MKIKQTITINKPANEIWHLIAHRFDQAHLWMDPIPHSFSIGSNDNAYGAPMEGRICHLSENPHGAKAKEIITQYDELNKILTFEVTSINVPAIIPLKKNVVQISVKSVSSTQSEVTWIARPQLKTPAYLIYPLLRLALPSAFSKLLKGLKTYAEENQLDHTPAIAASAQ